MENFGGKNQEKRLLTGTTKKGDPGSHLLTANVELRLIIFSECEVLREGWHALLYIGGGTLCLAGIIFSLDRSAKSLSCRRMPTQGSGNPPREEAAPNQFALERSQNDGWIGKG